MTTSPNPARLTVAVGQMIGGRYVVDAVLGEGGMGVVVRARHASLGSLVALKFMHSELSTNPEMRARFRGEAERVALMQSEHVARVLDVGELPNGIPYIVMEYVEGKDLASVLRERGPLPVAESVDYLLQACEGIAEAHSRGIVHRDIKPANLFVARLHDGSALVKVLDFGIAKTLPHASRSSVKLTQTYATMGSPYYASPEQLDSAASADQRSDIWALGVTLHELLTNQGPFAGMSQAAIMASIMTQAPVPLRAQRPELPEDLEWVIARCLEKDPDRRFLRVVDLAECLVSHGTHEAAISFSRISGIPGQERSNTVATPSGTPPPPGRFTPPSPRIATGGSAVVAVGQRAQPEKRRRLGRGWLIAATLGGILLLGALVTAIIVANSTVVPPPLPPPPPGLVHHAPAPPGGPSKSP